MKTVRDACELQPNSLSIKRMFKSLPDKAEIADIAEVFGRKLEEAAKSKTANRGAEAIAEENLMREASARAFH